MAIEGLLAPAVCLVCKHTQQSKWFFRSILHPCEVASAATSYLESGGASHASVLLEHYGSLPTVKLEPPQQSNLLRPRRK